MSTRSHRRRAGRVWIGALAAAITALVAVPAATAHSVLIATEPGTGAVVETSPEQVLPALQRAGRGRARLRPRVRRERGAGRRRRRSRSRARRRSRPVSTATSPTAPTRWPGALISADSDPISGAFVFHVGAPGAQPGGIGADVLADTPFLTDVIYTGGRFFEFVFLLLCAGGIAALIYALRSADARLHRRLYGLLACFAGALAVFALLGLPFQGAAAAGTSIGAAFSWDVVSSVAETRYGKVELVRAGLALAPRSGSRSSSAVRPAVRASRRRSGPSCWRPGSCSRRPSAATRAWPGTSPSSPT